MAFSPVQQRLGEQRQHAENKGRLAQVFARMRTDGQGTHEFEERIDFGVTFVERPFFATGCQIDLDHARDALGVGADEDVLLPQVTAYVTDWDMTDRDHYVGCWVAITVAYAYAADYPADAQVKIFHDLTWAAVALKDIPLD